MVPIDLVTFADGYFGAIEAGDFARIEALMADDCEVHANFLDGPNNRATTLSILRWLHRNVRDLRYDVVRREELPGGYVQQHVLRGIAPDGSELRVPACLIVSIADGRITRIDEYLDSAHVRALTGQ
jgi:ketosteroid isomerase-like protein